MVGHDGQGAELESPLESLGEGADQGESFDDRTGWKVKAREALPPLQILAVEGTAPEGTEVVADVLGRELNLHYLDSLVLEEAQQTDAETEVLKTTQGVSAARVTVSGPTHTIASDYAIYGEDGLEDAEAEFLLCDNAKDEPYPVSVRMFAMWQPQPEGVNCTIGPSEDFPGAFDITFSSDRPKVWVVSLNYLRMDAPKLESVLPGFEPTPNEAPYETTTIAVGARVGGMDTALSADPV
ncbi:hypothetical protein [Corynebacterium sp. 13CS0277]|uniref:hypothetical protein n=1 Tax=Corynebacterium sp. 13CS0277 TaxID=2071994 RepID=UPI0011B2460E|nr:hypothetical protein [Corynebacterium sp. 13CS0277]